MAFFKFSRIVFTQVMQSISVLLRPRPRTSRCCVQPASVSDWKHQRPSETTVVDGTSDRKAQEAISSLLNALTLENTAYKGLFWLLA